jgi:hypothetical protein
MDMPMKNFLDDEIYQNQPDKSKARDEALRDYIEQKHNAALSGPDAHDYRLQRSVFLTRGLGHDKKLNFIEQIIDSLVSLQESKEQSVEEEKSAVSAYEVSSDDGESDVTGGGDVLSDNGESDVTGGGDVSSDNGESDVTGGDEEQETAATFMDVHPSEYDDDGKELEFKDYEQWEKDQHPHQPPEPPPSQPQSEPEEEELELPHAVPPARVVQGYSYSLGHPSELGFGPGRPGYARRVARTSK